MPYKSKAQQCYFHAKLPQYAHEWDEATKHKKGGFKKLPGHVKKGIEMDTTDAFGVDRPDLFAKASKHSRAETAAATAGGAAGGFLGGSAGMVGGALAGLAHGSKKYPAKTTYRVNGQTKPRASIVPSKGAARAATRGGYAGAALGAAAAGYGGYKGAQALVRRHQASG